MGIHASENREELLPGELKSRELTLGIIGWRSATSIKNKSKITWGQILVNIMNLQKSAKFKKLKLPDAVRLKAAEVNKDALHDWPDEQLDKISDLMMFSRRGALIQPFVIQALKTFSQEVLRQHASGELKTHGLIYMAQIECMEMVKPGVCRLTLDTGSGGGCLPERCLLARKAKANNLTVVPPRPETIKFVNH